MRRPRSPIFYMLMAISIALALTAFYNYTSLIKGVTVTTVINHQDIFEDNSYDDDGEQDGSTTSIIPSDYIIITSTTTSSSAEPTTISTTTTTTTTTTTISTLIDASYSSNNFMSSSQSCVIPIVEPDFSKIPTKIEPILCNKSPTLENPVRTMGQLLHVDNKYGDQPISCSYSPIEFETDFTVTKGTDELPLQSGLNPCPADVMHVTCRDANDSTNALIFENTFRCLRLKQEVMARISDSDNNNNNNEWSKTLFEERLNILIIGFDSVSHVSWLEQLPKTSKFFVEQLGGNIFDGYNIVGDGTTAAILGMTTGYTEDELHESRRGFEGAKEVDDFPFIWHQLLEQGRYTTLWDEEQSTFGTFQYRLMGFLKPPVDYYGRPFRLFVENQPNRDDYCFGSLSHLKEHIRLLDDLFEIYPDPLLKFVFIFSSIFTHTSAESGLQDLYRLDDELLSYVKAQFDKGYFANSLLIFMADHGSRYSGSRATQRGKVTERLPFLGMAFPEWFRKKYPDAIKNLLKATKTLTTPFDLHATLLDVAGLQAVPDTPSRGISFFKSHPPSRTCEDAGVLPHWCMCLQNEGGKQNDIDVHDPIVTRCMTTFEKFVNEELLADLIKSDMCERVKVEEAFAVQRFQLRREVATFVKTLDVDGRNASFDDGSNNDKATEEYIQVSFKTSPGNGQWEATFTHNLQLDNVTISFKQISRTNLYGSAPKCILDQFPYLRPFCYCKVDVS